MNPNARRARAALREMTREAVAVRREIRAVRRASRAVAGGEPQTARTHLLNAGVPVADVDRFVSAFSRGVVTTTSVRQVVHVRRSGATQANHYKVVRRTAKTYDLATFHARLAVYRPKNDPAAAARFDTAARAA